VDVQKKLDEIVSSVGSARSMPMSASCVVNRAELLAMLEEVRGALPDSLAHAEELIGGRDRMVDDARQEATRIIESAHAERAELISGTEVARKSQEEADRILGEARQEAEEIRAEADDYVDSKLANFEVVLTKTIGSVDRGRDKLLGRAPGGDGMDDEPERSADPHTLRQRADAYVDTKLGAVSAVLTKTLEAVGRGRQKLLGSRPADELGVHMAAQDATAQALRTSDDDYLAELAQSQDAAAVQPAAMQPPVAQPAAMDPAAAGAGYYAATAGYQQQDAYGYQQQHQYVQQPDPYVQQAQQAGYPQQDGYQQQDAYGWQQPQGYDPNGYAPDQLQQPAYPQQPPYPPQQPGAALDETSLFDTSMIDLDQLRQYEEGR
jgi:vacuolar-type H+-ATPase subunit H